jgi:hypothetical protein
MRETPSMMNFKWGFHSSCEIVAGAETHSHYFDSHVWMGKYGTEAMTYFMAILGSFPCPCTVYFLPQL